jgi:F-type H+-transporting ATPase subunit a
MIEEDVIKSCIGENYRRYSPYLLTVFFFILINNLMGLVPFFPGGANTTGNIAVTFVLAMFSLLFINLFGTREYWREIFWPEVPLWLKVPLPLMPVMEFIGILTKPFALMIRLFANTLAGHSIILGLVCLIFVMHATMDTLTSGGLSFVLVLLTFFMSFIELLVAFIQAYVFTLLTSVFIGLSQIQNHKLTEKT